MLTHHSNQYSIHPISVFTFTPLPQNDSLGPLDISDGSSNDGVGGE